VVTAMHRGALLFLLLLTGCPDSIGLGIPTVNGLAAPSDLYAYPNGGSEVPISWTDNSSVETGFRLEVYSPNVPPLGSIVDYKILPPNTSSYAYPSTPNRSYAFRLFALTDTLESEPSNLQEVQTPNSPVRVQNVAAVPLSFTEVVVTWTDVAGETSYVVEVSGDGGVNWNPLGTAGADATTATVTSLTPGHRYLIEVVAQNAVAGSTPSVPVEVVLPIP